MRTKVGASGSIEFLEREVRRLRLFVACSSIAAVLGFARGTHPGVDEAREFRLVDETGRARAVLGLRNGGDQPGLALLAEDGTERGAFEVVRAGGRERIVRLVLRDAEGQRQVELCTEDEHSHGDNQRLSFFFTADADGPEMAYMELGRENGFVDPLCKLVIRSYGEQELIALDAGMFGACPQLRMTQPEVPPNHPAHGWEVGAVWLGMSPVDGAPTLDLVTKDRHATLSSRPASRGPELLLATPDAERRLGVGD